MTSAIEWHFDPLTPGQTVREPIADTHFTSDAVGDPGEALVREGIQNSLDAGTGGPVSVRIALSEVRTTEVIKYLAGAEFHHRAEDNGLRQDEIEDGPTVSVLAFEDFGTTGLQGDPTSAYPPSNGDSSFYHFFRAEGRTEKEGKRGSWGLGKDAFYRSGRRNTVFGLTVREGGQALLMGKTVLRSHSMSSSRVESQGHQRRLYQDGYFGVRNTEGPVVPASDRASIADFRDAFGLERRHEPGLSVVVPWQQEELSAKAIVRAVIRNYAYAILTGNLEVTVCTATRATRLRSETFVQEAAQRVR